MKLWKWFATFTPIRRQPRGRLRPRASPPASIRSTVLGGGKTGFDAVLWLLAHGKPPERITWVVPSYSYFPLKK